MAKGREFGRIQVCVVDHMEFLICDLAEGLELNVRITEGECCKLKIKYATIARECSCAISC